MVEKFTDGGPQHYACVAPCRGAKEWHRCRLRFCFVPGCRESSVAKPLLPGESPSLPWGETFWCKECGGYIEYDEIVDTFYEGPWAS